MLLPSPLDRNEMRLWEIMLCSWFRALEISVTFRGPSPNISRIANRVGLDKVEKKRWQVLHKSFFMSTTFTCIFLHMKLIYAYI